MLPALLGDAARRGLDQRDRRRARPVARELDARRPRPGERVEVQHRDDVPALRGASRVAQRPEPAVGAAVGGEEDERVRRLHARLRLRLRPRVGAGELEQRRRAARVVVRARPGAGVVAVRDHRDHVRRGALHDRHHVLEAPLAEARDRLLPHAPSASAGRRPPSSAGTTSPPRARPRSPASGPGTALRARARAPRPRRASNAGGSVGPGSATGFVTVASSSSSGSSTTRNDARYSRALTGRSIEPRRGRRRRRAGGWRAAIGGL